MQAMSRKTWARWVLLTAVLGAAMALPAGPTQAQELPTGAARVVAKVKLMALTGKSEIDYTVAQILENNAGKIPHP